MIKHNIDDIPRQAHLKELWDKIDAINKYLEELENGKKIN
jgi:hypothetical protein